ncbi:hypothetical protein [Conchiformibius kuhniae]|uniref:Uncharacterized protein n=1 Tax=Conchiformibius kuhniae TaxID=211502 RepID=A0A8T9MVM7_9NEIS|nr:hypothetical protein [Conchiformibius kuhniae]UOP05184.1 hypothetical protein LVJ77_02760 [Conchiformibius kuhniae]
MMKTLALTMAAVLFAAAVPAQAAVPIKFAKGSYCGSYSGKAYGNTTFTLKLKAGQTLQVNNISARYIVTNPSQLRSLGCDSGSCEFVAKQNGVHRITLRGSGWETVEFCAH